MRRLLVVIALVACGKPHRGPDKVKPAVDSNPDGPHREAIAALVQPLVDGEIASGIVIAVYDGGKREIYGFGAGPNGGRPDGRTLFEIGSVTKVFTSLLLADAVQRHEITLDTPVVELLPPGVTVPTQDKKVITLKQLALHTSGLPRLPPSLMLGGELADPYAKFNEDRLYADLIRTALEHPPGDVVSYSNYGAGLLGFALGRKLGGGYAAIVEKRVLAPLGLRDTFVTIPEAAKARRATGTNDDLAAVAPWTFDALAGAGAIVSDARDQLRLVEAELDAAAGSREPLRPAMRMTQEAQLEHSGDNEGLGWQIDAQGRLWHNGETGGFHAFVGFDPKNRRGVVVLASTALPLLDKLAEDLYRVLAGDKVPAPVLPNEDQLAQYAGTYDLGGDKVTVSAAGKRLHVELQGAPKLRAIPVSDKTFFLGALQALAAFERDDQARVVRIVFFRGDQRITASRVEPPPK